MIGASWCLSLGSLFVSVSDGILKFRVRRDVLNQVERVHEARNQLNSTEILMQPETTTTCLPKQNVSTLSWLQHFLGSFALRRLPSSQNGAFHVRFPAFSDLTCSSDSLWGTRSRRGDSFPTPCANAANSAAGKH